MDWLEGEGRSGGQSQDAQAAPQACIPSTLPLIFNAPERMSTPKNILTRRSFLNRAGLLAGPLLAAVPAPPLALAAAQAGQKLKVVCVGGHPDDPESGCAGTLARYAALGHSVVVIYLTRGERGIRDKSIEEAAKIRTAECEEACKFMGGKAVFFGQIDGAT